MHRAPNTGPHPQAFVQGATCIICCLQCQLWSYTRILGQEACSQTCKTARMVTESQPRFPAGVKWALVISLWSLFFYKFFSKRFLISICSNWPEPSRISRGSLLTAQLLTKVLTKVSNLFTHTAEQPERSKLPRFCSNKTVYKCEAKPWYPPSPLRCPLFARTPLCPSHLMLTQLATLLNKSAHILILAGQ
jgi:hypothetical protein